MTEIIMCLASLTNVPEQLHEWNITSVKQVNWKAVLWNMETLNALVFKARFNIVTQIHWSFYCFKLDSKKGFKPWEKTKQLWQKQGVHLVQTSFYSSSDATISIFNFGTLITRCNWIKETEWFEKSLTDSIRQVSTQNRFRVFSSNAL